MYFTRLDHTSTALFASRYRRCYSLLVSGFCLLIGQGKASDSENRPKGPLARALTSFIAIASASSNARHALFAAASSFYALCNRTLDLTTTPNNQANILRSPPPLVPSLSRPPTPAKTCPPQTPFRALCSSTLNLTAIPNSQANTLRNSTLSLQSPLQFPTPARRSPRCGIPSFKICTGIVDFRHNKAHPKMQITRNKAHT